MQWSDVTSPPKERVLRQFAGLWLVLFSGLAVWRVWQGYPDGIAAAAAIVGLGLGSLGLWRPAVMRYVFTGWLIAAFPIGWTVSRLALAAVFWGVFTPIALGFRLTGRDALRLRRTAGGSYWTDYSRTRRADEYLRQF